MNSRSPAVADRYQTLDAWRGIAALTVVIFHCTATVVTADMGPWAAALLHGWAGVFIFFPISGYCICAAVSRRENSTLGQFLFRRWHRIAPPYWASLILAVAAGFLAAPFNGGLIGYLDLGVPKWMAVATLTQGFSSRPYVINPVYWSLCYEEQFYIVMALTLLAPGRYRFRLLLAVTIAAGVYRLAWPASLRIDGLFLRHWLEFGSGIAVFMWLHRPDERRVAAAMFAIVAVTAVISRDLGVAISAGMATALVVLAPFDDAVAATRIGAALGGFGLFSYSLYLVHVPIGGRVVNLLRRVELPFLFPSLVAIVVSVVAGWCFYWLVEKRFTNRVARSRPTPVVVSAGRDVAAAI